MEVESQNSVTTEDSAEQEVPYIAPEVAAALAGEAVDFGKDFVKDPDEEDEVVETRLGANIN